MTRWSFIFFCALAWPLGAAPVENWPQFRGPTGDGRAPENAAPQKFSETERVKWKTAIHGKGWSSPVVWGGQVWVTTATEDGRELSVLCLDRDNSLSLRKSLQVGARDVGRRQCTYFDDHISASPGNLHLT